MSNYTIHRHSCHSYWSHEIPSALEVASGSTICLETTEASGGQITPSSDKRVFDDYDSERVNPVTGPIYIADAEPGDTLVVEILEMTSQVGWGWSAIIPGFGLLADEFSEPELFHWYYDKSGAATSIEFQNIAAVPFAPFVGTIGIAPKLQGKFEIIPPLTCGGNIDVPQVAPGSRIYLPVQVAGALLSLGDTHAAQGYGEVCGTAIESAFNVSIRVDVEKGRQVRTPWIRAGKYHNRFKSTKKLIITTGINSDIQEACKDAVRMMIDLLANRHRITEKHAYVLCSVCGDLAISQIVNKPIFTATFTFDEGVFG